MKEYGYSLLRFSNEDVLNNLEHTLGVVRIELNKRKNIQIAETASPSPLERGQGGEVSVTAKLIEIAGEADLEKGLQKGIDVKDSVGGIIECRVNGLPIGLGEPHFDSVESVIAHAMFSIPAVKGVESGAGFAAARMFGSEHNDAIENMEGKTTTNYAGGIVGGITNGNELVFRIAIKPTAST
ncbi:MAG: chorismate synthase, partial [Niabella sp.]